MNITYNPELPITDYVPDRIPTLNKNGRRYLAEMIQKDSKVPIKKLDMYDYYILRKESYRQNLIEEVLTNPQLKMTTIGSNDEKLLRNILRNPNFLLRNLSNAFARFETDDFYIEVHNGKITELCYR